MEGGGAAQKREMVMSMVEYRYFVDSVPVQTDSDFLLEGHFWVVPQNLACCSPGSVDIRHFPEGHSSKISSGQGHFEILIQNGVHLVAVNAGWQNVDNLEWNVKRDFLVAEAGLEEP